mmetsp:Transcript_11023/g.12605  ORF Transcript_11023/g.12605 Transcript_11023/m.12605 type:complete len:359 (-) Transcript_11023:100-1176(-)
MGESSKLTDSKHVLFLQDELSARDKTINTLQAKIDFDKSLINQSIHSEKEGDGNNSSEKLEKRVHELQQQLDVAERKVKNAKHLSNAHEIVSQEAQLREKSSEKRALESNRSLKWTKERLKFLENNVSIEKLQVEYTKRIEQMMETEKHIREIVCDPLLQAPVNSAKRRRFQKLKSLLKLLRTEDEHQKRILDELKDEQNSHKKLRKAANNDDENIVRELLSKGVGVNIPDDTGFSAFDYACGKGHTKIVKLMLASANINTSEDKLGPLLLATKGFHSGVVKLLIEAGAELEVTDESGRTPFLNACTNGDYDSVNIFLGAGANVKATDNRGKGGIELCPRPKCRDIARCLLSRGLSFT